MENMEQRKKQSKTSAELEAMILEDLRKVEAARSKESP